MKVRGKGNDTACARGRFGFPGTWMSKTGVRDDWDEGR